MEKSKLKVGDTVKVFVHGYSLAQKMKITDLDDLEGCKVRLLRTEGDSMSEWYVHTHQIVELIVPFSERECRMFDIAMYALGMKHRYEYNIRDNDQVEKYKYELQQLHGNQV